MTKLDSTMALDQLRASVLACPRCRNCLAVQGEVVECEGCRVQFPVHSGVAALVPDPETASSSFYAVDDGVRFGRDARMSERYARPVREFLTTIGHDSVVVEIGSGRGAFDGSHPGYVATDYSLVALTKYSHGARVQADAQALPFRDGGVDAFFSVATLEHVPDPARALEELDRCLKPGGRMLLYPAWYVRPWAAKALLVRPYRDLPWADRLRKASIPVRNGKPYQFARVLPSRLRRELRLRRDDTRLAFDWRRLEPNLVEHLISDSDAFASLDPQAVSAYFLSRGYSDLGRPSAWRRALYGFEPVLLTKPGP